jgi:hypothetical protein
MKRQPGTATSPAPAPGGPPIYTTVSHFRTRADADVWLASPQRARLVPEAGPYSAGEPGVTNEYVQRYCPFDSVDHGDLSYDPVVFQLVLNALDPATARYPNCLDEYPALA